MKRFWPVLLVMFMLCLWAAAPVANAALTDIETPSITNIISPDIPKAGMIAPIDSVASVDAPVIGGHGPRWVKIRCCSSTVASFIDDNSKTTAPKLTNTTIYATVITKKPGYHLTL